MKLEEEIKSPFADEVLDFNGKPLTLENALIAVLAQTKTEEPLKSYLLVQQIVSGKVKALADFDTMDKAHLLKMVEASEAFLPYVQGFLISKLR